MSKQKNILQGKIPMLNMITDYPRSDRGEPKGDTIKFALDHIKTEDLKKLGFENGATLYIILLATFNVLLAKYTGQEDIIMGLPIGNRQQREQQNITVENIVPVINTLQQNMNFVDFLQTVKIPTDEASENQSVCSEELIDNAKQERDFTRATLFDIIFVLGKENPARIDLKSSKLDIAIYGFETCDKIQFQLEYCTKLYKKETIERFIYHYQNLIEHIIEHPKTAIKDIDILSELEKEQLTKGFNNTNVELDRSKTIHQLFEEKAKETPDRVALEFKDKTLTYSELNNRANSVARTLREKGVKQDDIVGIMVEQSIEMIVGIIAILKAGGAYLPINPKNPIDRIKYILQDSNINLLLTQNRFVESDIFEGYILNLEDEQVYKNNCGNLDNSNEINDLAYVMYTSGSTGRPKGTMIEHSSVINTLKYLEVEYPLEKGDSFVLKTNYAFDVSVTELFGWFIGAGSLVILDPEEEENIDYLIDIIEEKKITHINFAPSVLNIFVEALENNGDRVKSLKYVFSAGEAISRGLVKKFEANIKGVRLENLYGPTETTIYATRYSTDNLLEKVKVPIGRPIGNTQIYILDKNNKVQAMGLSGEICIAGRGLARGYLNLDDLTKSKFIDNPFDPGGKMYKTGDLGRWIPDGNIEFLGRIDNQVKLRGLRIELGEIESKLMELKEIKEALVLDKQDSRGATCLCAYIISTNEIKVKNLREYLLKKLPQYMIPSYFIQLDTMPLTANGKIDKEALPNTEMMGNPIAIYEAPRNSIEEKLIEIWRALLGLNKISIQDEFLELGGHSLKAMEAAFKIHKVFNVKISLKELFKLSTIRNIGEYIQRSEKSIYKRIKPVETKEYYDVSSAQKRMFIMKQFDLNSVAYNMPVSMLVEGNLDIENLEESFKKLIQRHESLRTVFESVEGKIVQKIMKEVEFKLDYIEKTEDEINSIIEEFVKPFDLGKAPLLRVGIIKIDKDKHVLMYDMHHIISDGESLEILMKEFAKIYGGKPLDELKIQYKDYANWQKEFQNSIEMRKQEEYWHTIFSDEIPLLNMPLDYGRTEMNNEGDIITHEINEELTKGLNRISKETGSTMYMILLACLNILLAKYSGQKDIIIGSPISGRTHLDLDKIIGVFVNILAIRNYPEDEKTYEEFLGEVRDNSLKAFENQYYQFEELVSNLKLSRSINRNPLFDVMFTLDNTGTQYLEIDDLTFKPVYSGKIISKFDFSLNASETLGTIKLSMIYNCKLFKKTTIESMLKHYENILAQVVKDSTLRLDEIRIFSADDIGQDHENNNLEIEAEFDF